jgi:hypothetical protein
MGALLMWLGMAGFILALICTNTSKTQQLYLQKLGKPPDAKYKKLNLAAKLLFAAGISLWIAGAIMTMGAGGK